MGTIKCAECGLLALRQSETRDAHEAEQRTRESGHATGFTESNPYCFAQAQRIDKECFELKQTAEYSTNPYAGVLAVIQHDRECARFVPWQPGRSPKEHQEMVNAQELQRFQDERQAKDQERQEQRDAAQREWQAAQEDARREREAARELANRKWQEEQNEKNRTWQLHLALLAVVVGAIGWAIGKYADRPQPQPIIIQQPVESKPASNP